MDLVKQLVDVFLHLDRHLAEVVRDYGTLTNVILFVHRLLRDRPRRDAVPARATRSSSRPGRSPRSAR